MTNCCEKNKDSGIKVKKNSTCKTPACAMKSKDGKGCCKGRKNNKESHTNTNCAENKQKNNTSLPCREDKDTKEKEKKPCCSGITCKKIELKHLFLHQNSQNIKVPKVVVVRI